MICATNMPTREAELIRSLNVLRETKYYQVHGEQFKIEEVDETCIRSLFY